MSSLSAEVPAEKRIRRIHAHLIIQDENAALEEARLAIKEHPEKKAVHKVYIKALAKSELIREAIRSYRSFSSEDPELLEEICWSILEKGLKSPQYAIRVQALIGAYFANDRKSVQILCKMMDDENAILRSIAVQLSSLYKDRVLQKKIQKLFHEEKNWMVRSQLITALGKMQISEEKGSLENVLEKNSSSFEEKQLAVQSLVLMHEDIDEEKLIFLSKSSKAEMRFLACKLAERFEKLSAKKAILPLIQDTNPQVQIAAIQALSWVFRFDIDAKKALLYLEDSLKSLNPEVAVTAAWATALIDEKKGWQELEKLLFSPSIKKRRLAAAALPVLGEKGATTAKNMLEKSFDPYVRLHFALALISQRKELDLAKNILHEFFVKKIDKWEFGEYKNLPFPVFRESEVNYLPHIPNYPDLVDATSQLQLLSYLAILQDKRADSLMKTFLERKAWGISGLASSLLMKEGDEDTLEVIGHLLDSQEPSIKIQAALILAFLGKDERAKSVLEKAYFTEAHQYKRHILEALGKVSDASSSAFFLEALEEPFDLIRLSAASSLIQALKR